MQAEVTPAAAESFYRAALGGLVTLEDRAETRKRFGPDADARWDGFKGHLRTSDRVDILCRDAAVTWGPAFSAAQAFRLFGLAPDEAFGPDWPGVTDDVAQRLWKEAEAYEVGALGEMLSQLRLALGLAGDASPPGCPDLSASDRVLVSGPAAIVAAARAFATDDTLSWSDQVLVIATSPAERQLAGLAAVLLDARGPTRLLAPGAADGAGKAPAEAVKEAGLPVVNLLLVSDDADPACKGFAQAASDAIC